MRTMYCIFQTGSSPAYAKGVIAICTSLRKAIKLISKRYKYDVNRFKPKECNLIINGILSYYDLSDNNKNAWIKVEIRKESTNKIINILL